MLTGNQDVRVCQTVCALAGLAGMWTENGPTEKAIQLQRSNGGALSASERCWMLLAWAVWNGDCQVAMADVLKLDSRGLAVVAALLAALAGGADAVDAWLRHHEPV